MLASVQSMKRGGTNKLCQGNEAKAHGGCCSMCTMHEWFIW